MSRNVWLAGRAALALVLMVSFYALALGVAAGLLWLAWLDLIATRHPSIRVIAFCVLSAGSVLWAILPRRDRFEAPGPRITPAEQPELFRLIHDVAKATSQPMPEDVYVMNDVNAFVARRGGIMGFGSRRVMGIGLPLMQSLSVDEFKGVLAHEFGHYHSGDVSLGPWIHKTRVAVGRTLAHLSDSALRYIFIPYAALFFRVTHAVSRRQEFIADEVAAGVVGAGAMASGLRKVNAAAVAYQSYWYTELVPVMKAGFRPPVTAGFGSYASRPEMARLMDTIVQREEQEGTTDPYDTHPSLRDRVAALERQASRPATDLRAAGSLLRHVDQLELQLFKDLSAELANLTPIDWAGVSEKVYIPMWRGRMQHHAALLSEYTCANPPTREDELARMGAQILPGETERQAHVGAAWQLLVAAYALALMPFGWTARTMPGEEVVLVRGSEELRPFSELAALVKGKSTVDQWRERCLALGIESVPLVGETGIPEGGTRGNLRGV